MTNNTDRVISWLKEFQRVWLPQTIPNNLPLLQAIKSQLGQLEQLLAEKNGKDEEYYRAKLLDDHSSSDSDTEQISKVSTSVPKTTVNSSISVPTTVCQQFDKENDEEQYRQLLLEQSDESDENPLNEDDTLLRPTIRIKRISQADAERYMPWAWRNQASKKQSTSDRSSMGQKNQVIRKSDSDDASNDSITFRTDLQPKTASKTQENYSGDDTNAKRKLTTSDGDRTSISSKTRDKDEASTNSSSSDDDDDESLQIRFRTRSATSHRTKKSSTSRSGKHRQLPSKTKDVTITYKPSTSRNELPSTDDDLPTNMEYTDPVNVEEEEDPVVDNIIENNENNSIHESLDITQEKPIEINVESPSNDQTDPPPPAEEEEESLDDRPPIEVPSYAHLLTHSKPLSSSSNSESADETSHDKTTEKLALNHSKRSLATSSSNSDTTSKKKKSRVVLRKRGVLSSLSSSSSDDENENEVTSTTQEDTSKTSHRQSPSLSSRLHIQRSSSSEHSTKDETSPSKSLRKRRKRSAIPSERSTILKEIQRIIKKKKTTSTADDNDAHQEASSDSTIKSQQTPENSNDEDDDDEQLSPSKRKSQGRRNIRKILEDKELENQTKEAIEAERERLKRIAEKQQKYNGTLLDQSSSMTINDDADEEQSSTPPHRLILELDKTTNEPLIEVAPKLVEQLKPHQLDGVKFLWNNVFESIDAIQNKKRGGNGCILAHCMGLGKTLQVITFLHTVFNYKLHTKVKTCLVLCPINAALNWSNELDQWLKNVTPPIDHYQLTTIKPNARLTYLNYWYENGGVMIMGYDLYRRLSNSLLEKNPKRHAETLKCLVNPGPDIIVADEGHILKNSQTALAKSLSKIRTPRRIVLTGTPLQNNLIEYYCMVSFIKPNLLGSQGEYTNRFVSPIQNGQHRDSNDADVRLMKRRACVLHELLTGFVDRKDYQLLKQYLPAKSEYIINIRLSDLQSTLYDIYLKQHVNREQRLSVQKNDFKSAKLFADYHFLQKIWTHPFLLYPHFIDRWKKRFNKIDDTVVDENELDAMFIDDEESVRRKKTTTNHTRVEAAYSYSGFLIDNIKDDQPTNRRTSSSSATTTTLDSESNDNDILLIDESDTSKKSDDDDDIEIIKTYPTRSRTTTTDDKEKNHLSKTRNDNIVDTGNDPVLAGESAANQSDGDCDEPWSRALRKEFWFSFLDVIPKECQYDLELSGKFLVLKFILDKCTEIGDKILLFSRSLYILNHIEKFLKHLQTENEKVYEQQCHSQRQLRQLLQSTEETEQPIRRPVEWVRDRDYFRMDGQTDPTTRKRYSKVFNNTSNTRARLFLISTLAGGMGINLVGGNRVIIFDASWNPSHDTQAIFRSYRFGQEKPVYIYRLLAHGTMEEKIYQRQVVKQSISQRVVDDHQLDRHFTQNDIKELYRFEPEQLPATRSASTLFDETNTEQNYTLPKDPLLFELLCEHNRWIHSYHSHDSLLENKLDEGLTPDERQKALEEYENLKRLPDQRQLAMQALQDQQRLNALIAQQHLQSADHQRFISQLYSNIVQSVQSPAGQHNRY